MEIVRDERLVKANGRNGVPYLELQLSSAQCAAGGQVSGVVVFHLAKPAGMRSLTVAISGTETPSGPHVSRSLRQTASFFDREILLSGMQQPKLTHERVSQAWNAFLGRDLGRTLSAGVHTYPFSIPLPASLPPTYNGRAGSVAYSVSATAQFPIGRAVKISRDVQIAAVPRPQRTRPVALTYPTSDSAAHANDISVRVDLPMRAVEHGESVGGRISVSNPRRAAVRAVEIALENCEWVRFASENDMQRETVRQLVLRPDDPEVACFETEFALPVPEDAVPTVEGTNIAVIWFLRIRLDTDPPVEFKAPVFVYSPLRD